MTATTRLQSLTLVLLRTVIGWHFAYEGWYKLAVPGWSRAGAPLSAWSAAGYLNASTGPLAGVFHTLAHSTLLPMLDRALPVALLLVGLSLMLGLLTQLGAAAGVLLLALFYAASIPLAGVQVPGAEGAYLLVNKTLVEAFALLVVLAFRTGTIAGLDVWRAGRRVRRAADIRVARADA